MGERACVSALLGKSFSGPHIQMGKIAHLHIHSIDRESEGEIAALK
jgi:hypothetical protein